MSAFDITADELAEHRRRKAALEATVLADTLNVPADGLTYTVSYQVTRLPENPHIPSIEGLHVHYDEPAARPVRPDG